MNCPPLTASKPNPKKTFHLNYLQVRSVSKMTGKKIKIPWKCTNYLKEGN